MAGKSVGGRKASRAARVKFEPLPPEAQARLDRRLALLLGFVPLPEMSQEETDWLFEQKLRIGGDD